MNSISETVNFRNKKLDESERSDRLAVSVTAYIGKKKSSISSSDMPSNKRVFTKSLICFETGTWDA